MLQRVCNVLNAEMKIIVFTLILTNIRQCAQGFGMPHDIQHSDYTKWTPIGGWRDDLFCPTSCNGEEECCCCGALTCWEIDADGCSVTVDYLHIEYDSLKGSSYAIALSTNSTVYELKHNFGRITRLPDNICDWNSTTLMDLSHNRIQSISDVKCLVNLYVLKLDFNFIEVIPNNTFTSFKYLTELSVSHNKLRYLDPYTIKTLNGNIANFNASFNDFISVDVTNIISMSTYCLKDFQGSYMRNITNTLNFTVPKDGLIGDGTINLNNTKSVQFINFSSIGMPFERSANQLNGQIYYDESSMRCDCNLYPIFHSLGSRTYEIWPNLLHNNFSCISPGHMKGRSLKDIFDSKAFEMLTCNIIENCPYKCVCIDRPSKNFVTVNCSGAGLTELPPDMPLGHWNNYRLDIHLDGNNIQTIHNRNYMHRIANLNLNGNPISNIPDTVAESFNELMSLNINAYTGSTIPRIFQKYNPASLNFGSNILTCDCSNLWIGRWLRSYSVTDGWRCYYEGVAVPIQVIDDYYIQCDESDEFSQFLILIIMVSVLSCLLLLGLVAYCFRFELLILKMRCCTRKNTTNMEDKFIDVFFSFNIENNEVYNYIIHQVRKRLLELNYSVYIPWLDNSPGATKEIEINNALNQSLNYVVVMCEMYNSDIICLSEFENIWSKHIANIQTRLIIINFDGLKTQNISNRPLKACVRVGNTLDFTARDDRLTDQMIAQLHRINKPFQVEQEPVYCFENDENKLGNTENQFPTYNDIPKLATHLKNVEYNVRVEPNVFLRLSERGNKHKTRKSEGRHDHYHRYALPKKRVDTGTCQCKFRRCYLSNTDNPWRPRASRQDHSVLDRRVNHVDIEAIV